MNYQEAAAKIIEAVGGRENIAHVTNCATRLRFNLEDEARVQEQALKAVKGVLGTTLNGGQYQVIIGPDVKHVAQAIHEILGQNGGQKNAGAGSRPQDGTQGSEQDESRGGRQPLISRALDVIAGIFTPILPAITGAAMIKAFLVVLTLCGLVGAESQTYRILTFISDAPFYFLPMLLAFTASVKFKCNSFLAVTLGGILLHPAFAEMLAEGGSITLFSLPVTAVSYGNSVLPIILIVWALSYVEHFLDRIMPKFMKFFAVPMLAILIMAPLALVVIGPLGTIAGNGVSAVFDGLNRIAPWIVLTLIGAVYPLLVMTGMHYSLVPLSLNMISGTGREIFFAAGALGPNIAQAAAALCVAVKSRKDKDMRSLAFSTSITAFCGITEPAMYGVNLKLKKPFIAVLIGGAVSGFYAGISGLHTTVLITPGLPTLVTYLAGNDVSNFINALITVGIAFVVTFAATFILYQEK